MRGGGLLPPISVLCSPNMRTSLSSNSLKQSALGCCYGAGSKQEGVDANCNLGVTERLSSAAREDHVAGREAYGCCLSKTRPLPGVARDPKVVSSDRYIPSISSSLSSIVVSSDCRGVGIGKLMVRAPSVVAMY